MKRHISLGLVGVFALFGCASGVPREHEGETEAADVEVELDSKPSINCVAQCVQFARFCQESGEPPEVCSADLESCKEACYENTCEPGAPDCCPYRWSC